MPLNTMTAKSLGAAQGGHCYFGCVAYTSKTPLSMYLAHKRLKVANVPLVPEIMPPEELFQDAAKIVGLIIDPPAERNSFGTFEKRWG